MPGGHGPESGEHGYAYGFGNEREVHSEGPQEITEEEALAMATAAAEDVIRMLRQSGKAPTRTKSEIVAGMMEIILPKRKGTN